MITVEQIEQRVERYTDHLDRVFLARQIDQKTYDAAMRDISAWAQAKYEEAERTYG